MHRTRLVVLAAIPLVTLTLVAASPAHPTAGRVQSFELTTTGQQVVGTTYLETDTLTAAGAPAGLALLTCPGAAQDAVAVAHCDLTLGLAGGTVTATVSIDNATGAAQGRITGGTGRYSGLRGALRGVATDTGSTLTLTSSRAGR